MACFCPIALFPPQILQTRRHRSVPGLFGYPALPMDRSECLLKLPKSSADHCEARLGWAPPLAAPFPRNGLGSPTRIERLSGTLGMITLQNYSLETRELKFGRSTLSIFCCFAGERRVLLHILVGRRRGRTQEQYCLATFCQSVAVGEEGAELIIGCLENVAGAI